MLNKSLSGIGWVTGFSLAQLVANVLLTMILARLLSPEEFGSYALCLVIISFLQIFAQMGTGAAVVGTLIAVLWLGEAPPPYLGLAGTLVALGTLLFHRGARAGLPKALRQGVSE